MLDPDAAPDIAMYQLVGALDAFTSVVDVPMTLCAMWFWARIVRMQDDRFGLVARF
jgi:hypothetical protein